MILVFQKYHFNFTAGDAKLCWISIFTFSSPILFILFLCFLGNFSQCILCSLPVTGAIFIGQKAKVSELLSGSNCCSLCHLTTVSMLQLPLFFFFSLPSSVCSSLCLLFAQNTLDLEASAGALHAQAPPATLLNPPPPPPTPFWIPCAHFQPNPMKFLLLAIKI